MTERADSVAAPPPSAAEAVAWTGLNVDDRDGARVGRAHGVFVDSATGEPVWLVVALERRVALLVRRRVGIVVVPLRDCAATPARVWTAHRSEALRSAPTVDPTRPLLREHELAICAHYGIGERVGRAAEVAGRAAGTVTAEPA